MKYKHVGHDQILTPIIWRSSKRHFLTRPFYVFIASIYTFMNRLYVIFAYVFDPNKWRIS